MNRWSPYLLSILRIIAAFVYMVAGIVRDAWFRHSSQPPAAIGRIPVASLNEPLCSATFSGRCLVRWVAHDLASTQGSPFGD